MDSAGFVAVRRSIVRGWLFLRGSSGWRLGASGVVASLLTVQLLLVAHAGLGTMRDAALEQGAVHLDILPGTLDQRVQELHVQLQAIPSVRGVRYVPREQVFADERSRDASLEEFLEQYDMVNPFPDTFVVTPRDAGAYADLRAFVEASETGIDAVALSDIAAREAAAGTLLGVAATARLGVMLLVLLTAFGASLLSFNVLVHVAAMRRPDVALERLAGATAPVLSAPGVSAGVVVLLGALLASMVLTVAVVALLAAFPSTSDVGSWLMRSAFTEWSAFPVALAVEAAILVVLAWAVGRAGSVFRS